MASSRRVSGGCMLACALFLSLHGPVSGGGGPWPNPNTTVDPVSLAAESTFTDCVKTDDGIFGGKTYKCRSSNKTWEPPRSRKVKGADEKESCVCVYTCDNDASASGVCNKGLGSLTASLHAPECSPAPSPSPHDDGVCPHALTVLGFDEAVIADTFPHPGPEFLEGPSQMLVAPRSTRYVDVQTPGPFTYRGVLIDPGTTYSGPHKDELFAYGLILVDAEFDLDRNNIAGEAPPRRQDFPSLNAAYVSTPPVNLILDSGLPDGYPGSAPAKLVFTFPEQVIMSSVFVGQPNTVKPHVSIFGDKGVEGCVAEVFPPGDQFPVNDTITGNKTGYGGHGVQYNFPAGACRTKQLTLIGNTMSDLLNATVPTDDWFLSVDSLTYC